MNAPKKKKNNADIPICRTYFRMFYVPLVFWLAIERVSYGFSFNVGHKKRI